MCWETLSRQDADSLLKSPTPDYATYDGNGPLDLTRTQKCLVSTTPKTPRDDLLDPLAFVVEYGGAEKIWPYGVRSFSEGPQLYRDHFPLGNSLNGWTGNKNAAVWLPDACTRNAASGGNPVKVSIDLRDGQEKEWGPEETRRRVTAALMKTATGLAEKLGCSTPAFQAASSPPSLPTPQDVNPEGVCGLTGFAPLTRTHAQYVHNTVSGSDYRMWSCVLTTPEEDSRGQESAGFAAFTITQNQQLIAEYERQRSRSTKEAPPSTTLLNCDATKTLAHLAYPDGGKAPADLDRARANLVPERDLFDQFTLAVSKSLRCDRTAA